MNVNKWFGVGRLSMDPILKNYDRPDGSQGVRCFFRLAITREADRGKPRAEQHTDFVPVTCWGRTAEVVGQYLQKGTEVTVSGELRVNRNQNEDGSFGPDMISINARDIQFGRRSQKNQAPAVTPQDLEALEQRLAGAAAGSAPEASTTPANPYEDAA